MITARGTLFRGRKSAPPSGKRVRRAELLMRNSLDHGGSGDTLRPLKRD
jgi:hypothetical protein